MNGGNRIGILGVLFIASACGANVMNEETGCDGDGGEKLEPTRWKFPPSNELPNQDPCVHPAPGTVSGTWTGELDDFALGSGSRAVHVAITGSGTADGSIVCGSITFGTGSPPPLPTDPNAAPPGTKGYFDGPDNAFANYEHEPVEGFAYQFLPFHAPDWGLSGERLQLAIVASQPFKAWCEMQTSYPPFTALSHGNRYSCAPEHTVWHVSPDAGDCWLIPGPVGTADYRGPKETLSCAQLHICQSLICACSDYGCSVNTYDNLAFVDLKLEGGALVGDVVWQGKTYDLRLTRSP